MSELWTVRDANAGDRNGLICLWLESFLNSTYGKQYKFEGGKALYWKRHEPRVKAALARSTVKVACDSAAPEVILAFVAIEGDDVVHYMMAKRTMHRAGESAAMFKAMLGPLLERACTVTHELPELNRAEVRAAGFTWPAKWICDSFAFRERTAA